MCDPVTAKIIHDDMGPKLVDNTPRVPHLTGEEQTVRVPGRSQSHYDVTIQRGVAVRCKLLRLAISQGVSTHEGVER